VQPDTFRTLAEYIHELQRRDRNNYSAGEQSPINTKVQNDSDWNQGNRSGDAGRSENSQG